MLSLLPQWLRARSGAINCALRPKIPISPPSQTARAISGLVRTVALAWFITRWRAVNPYSEADE